MHAIFYSVILLNIHQVYTLFQGSSKVYGIRDQRSARGWDQGSQP